MKRRFFALAAILLMATPVFAGDQAVMNQRLMLFRNVQGSALTSGTAVVLNLTDADNTTGDVRHADSDLGLLVGTTTVADNKHFVGVLADGSCADDQLCVFVVEGPVIARIAGSTDVPSGVGPTTGNLGTTTVAGNLGGGSNAGFMFSQNTLGGSNGAADGSLGWVWVKPGVDSD